MTTFAIVGASIAGVSAAATLREEGFDGRVVLIGAEPDLPYDRPPLSKGYLKGHVPPEKLSLRPPGFFDEHEIELRLGAPVVALDPGARELELSGGERCAYDSLLLATGGRNRQLPVPGADLPGVYALRTREDADRLREAAAGARAAVVVGMGFIGTEIAASLRQLGLDVTAIEPFRTPLERVLGPEVGGAIGALHEEHGVHCLFGEGVQAFEGGPGAMRVLTSSGSEIACELAVVGVGIVPAAELAERAGLAVENGILVDERCRTSADGIWAAGDVARHFHPLLRAHVRVEHWQHAVEHGAAAARSMLGIGEPYAEVHWFWSDQYESNLQYAGHHTTWDELVVRGSLDERAFVAFYVTDGVVRAAVALDRGRDLRRAIPLIRTGRAVDADALRDIDIDLRMLAATP